MFRKVGWLTIFALTLLVIATTPIHAQTETQTPTATLPPTPTATATPRPTATEPPAILIVQPTPSPTPPLPDNLGGQLRQVWEQNREAILLALIIALMTGVLVGVFFKNAAGKLAEWLGQFFHFLFDRFASVLIIRLRYEKDYRKTLADAVQHLQGQKLVAIDREIKLDKMYVPSLLTEDIRPDVGEEFVDRFRTREEMRRRQEKRSVGPWDAIRRYHRFVVLGGPGAGKTTYLYHLAFMCALRRQPQVENHIPIFIRFRQMVSDLKGVEKLEDVFPKVFADYGFPNADHFFERRLQQGRCLILLDGLDEVSSVDDHERLLELVQEFAHRHVRDEKHGENRNILVVSSRKYSYDHGQQLLGFPKTEVMEFDVPAIERFVHNWFGSEDARDSKLANELVEELKGNKRFLELAANPLLLLLITDHYDRQRHLPDLRADLYKHCVSTRIARWNDLQGTHKGRFGEDIKWRMLRQLALYVFQNKEKGLLWRTDLLDWLETFTHSRRLPKETTSEDLLDEVARTSGLIQEWAIDRYGFSHQTLQEFFAAEAAVLLGDEKGAALLNGQLDNPAWKEVILLYCGLVDNAEPLLKYMIGRAKQPGADNALWLLAAQCLAEGAQQVADPLRQELTDALLGLLSTQAEKPLTTGESEQAIEALHQFAPDLLPAHAQPLLQSDTSADLFLAQRLLTENAPVELRAEISQRLAAMTSSAKTEERQAAVAALGRLGAKDSTSATVLLSSLQDPDANARVEAALALGRLGQVGDIVAAALLQTYEHDLDDTARHAALEALLALGREQMLDMIKIPAGEFLMGSTDKDRHAQDREKPQHTVYLPAYFINRTPVTNAQFRRFIEAGGYANPVYWQEAIEAERWKEKAYVDYDGKHRNQPRYWDTSRWNDDAQPVIGVSWYEALAYSRWAGKRLPNEAEWEKAARGTDGRIYPWSNTWDAKRANSKQTGIGKTSPVGQYSPQGDSPYGVADMIGNVEEWCSTRWEQDYPYTPDDGREDLSGGDDVGRVIRGGNWNDEEMKWLRCAARFRYSPWCWLPSRGFRCCCATSSLSTSDS